MIIFDIETKPLPMEQLRAVSQPFDPSTFGPRPGEFDPSTVKTGNIKDEAKIAAKIAEAKAAHEERAARYDDDLAQAEARYWSDIQDKAALSAETGAVCAIGYANDTGAMAIDHEFDHSEEELLRRFWSKFATARKANRQMIGFNSNRFDVPFLVRRSWYVGVSVPQSVFTVTGYVCTTFMDLMDRWQCGDRRSYVSLDKVCRAAGLQGKPDDCTGAMFHQMLADEATREIAIEYLKNDLKMTLALARKMEVIQAA